LQEFFYRFKPMSAILLSRLFRLGIVNVVKAGQLPTGGRQNAFQVNFTEVAGTEEAYFHA
jgi:hypothetical protein